MCEVVIRNEQGTQVETLKLMRVDGRSVTNDDIRSTAVVLRKVFRTNDVPATTSPQLDSRQIVISTDRVADCKQLVDDSWNRRQHPGASPFAAFDVYLVPAAA